MTAAKTKNRKTVPALSCSECGVLNCLRRDSKYPDFCLTKSLPGELLAESLDHYKNNAADRALALAAAECEGRGYGRLTRVEETVDFARRIKVKKIGVASCVGLASECALFAKILRLNGFESYTAICKVGSVDKTEIGVSDADKVRPGNFEPLCNPVLQAKLLNKKQTGLNVIIGLCVGHDALFVRHSDAPVTTLIVKDRVLGHNPAAALYTSGFYYKRLLAPK
jgi:uncharacterized metal-binding protein